MTLVLHRGGLPRHPRRTTTGESAGLVVVPCGGAAEAVVVHPARTLVMKDGVVLHN
ncbi:hypothetical protein WBK31_02265 [Nonomuraea sp. N2-4H]|jgi:hypothetical protein|uniref:hypothetical protein n=1 Tax=Nonomuraea sp. N2-4H TaxID=3128898 RepID=UPI0032433E14